MLRREGIAAAALALAAAGPLAGCGEDMSCPGCVVPPRLTIKWEFNKDAAEGFSGDSCTDLQVREVEVEISSGADTFVASEACSFRQVVFHDPPPASYTVRLLPLDSDGELLTRAPVERSYFASGGASEEYTVVVAPQDWVRDYRGTFYFRLLWDGADCAAADPPVASHRLHLEVQGKGIGSTTSAGDPLDGSAPGPCRSFADHFPQSALMVPFGPATFTVEGLDDQGEPRFRQSFDTFVGAGVNNPELRFDVDPLRSDRPPDGGAPDGGAVDAGVADAGL